jgi:hypothetical protein
MELNVDIAVDPKAGLTPRSLRFDGRNVGVADVVDHWLGAGDQYFKVMDVSGNTYILRHDETSGAWELVMFLSKRGTAMDDLLGRATSPRSPHAGNGRL